MSLGLNLAYTCLVLSLKPHYSKQDMKYEIMNEIIILITTSILFLFTGDFIDDDYRLVVGITLISITVIAFLINMIPVVKMIKDAICRCGIYCKKRKEKKILHQLH